MGIVEQYLLQLKTEKRRLRRTAVVLTALSLIVATGVSWSLRMTGVTLANDACCGYEEHQHTDECLVQNIVCDYDVEPAAEIDEDMAFAPYEFDPILDSNSEGEPLHIHVDECYQTEYRCGYEEHLHSLACYSNPTADVETPLDWQEMFEDYPYTGNLCEDLVGIAKTQVGYAESALNFEADNDEVKHGYTRYGAWYGAPYNEWSAMFVSFCLHYAGADLSEYPINSGANTMAALWDAQGRYTQAGAYFPAAGDLVFFEDNTVGIVAQVQSATMYVICGDMHDAVTGSIMSVNDSLISGWGMIDKLLDGEPVIDEPIIDEPVYEDTVYFSNDDLYDISNGPVFVMSAKSRTTVETERAEPEPEPQEQPDQQQYSLLKIRFNSVLDESALAPRTGAGSNLIEYVEGRYGTFTYTLMNKNDEPIPENPPNHYEVTANEGYKLLLTIDCDNGIESGTYTLQLPQGLMYDGGTGSIILKDATDASNELNVGTWEVTGKGFVTIVFNEEMDSLTENLINATIGIHFPDAYTQIEFDGEVIVTVNPPVETAYPTKIRKGGHQGNENAGQDPTKIYWTIEVKGDKDSDIVGNTLSDSVVFGAWSETHRYTASDMEKGLYFSAGYGNEWHEWWISPDDPNLTWTETGWTYVMPATADCFKCGVIPLGDDGWTYNVSYTSTPDPKSIAGSYGYENVVSIDGQTNRGWVTFAQSDSYGVIEKSGAFVSDASGGNFVWELQVTIPGKPADRPADYYWYLMDYMYMYETDYANRHYSHNDANLSEVTVQYQGANVRVPNIRDATQNDLFAWDNAWSPTDESTGIVYGRQIALLMRCQCNEDSCQFGGRSSCWHYGYTGDSGWTTSAEFCQCWTVEEDLTFTFVYKTDAKPLIEAYGGQGYIMQNIAELFYKVDPYGNGVPADNAVAAQTIPGVFKEDITKEYKDYTASYKITVNEAKAVLTNGDPLIINDTMSNNMTYMSGSMVVTTEDVNGNVGMLRPNEDYTVTYDGSGSDAHVLQITILKPQPVMYILEYDTTLFKPESHDGGSLIYTNYATITLWGDTIKSDTITKVATEFNMAAKTYTLKLHKTCAFTKKALAGAVFGIYNPDGGLIVMGETDDEGYLTIQTDLKAGIIFKEHYLYYAQEHTPPAAYMLDDKENWFIFCNNSAETCDTCQALMGDKNAVRIPLGQIGNMDLVNEPISYELPATGGMGITLHVLCGMLLVSAPLVYGLSLRRKYERRSRE